MNTELNLFAAKLCGMKDLIVTDGRVRSTTADEFVAWWPDPDDDAAEYDALFFDVESHDSNLLTAVVAMGEKRGLSVCANNAMVSLWFIWDESNQNHLGSILENTYREAALAALEYLMSNQDCKKEEEP